jgi:hypothetical protein
LECYREYGTIETIRTYQKGRYFDALERFHIYESSESKLILNEEYATDSSER